MLQACLNGGRTRSEAPAAPVSPEALARDAVAVRAAGAAELHLHPRDAAGAETLAPAEVAAAVAAVRHAAPDTPMGVGTGAWIAPGGRARLAHIRGWAALSAQERPDYASVNLHEEDAPELLALLGEIGVAVEAGLWTPAAAERFAALSPAPPLRVLVEMTAEDGAEAERTAQATLGVLAQAQIAAPVLLHGENGSAWPMLRRAKALGHDARIGFEDVLTLPDGAPAPSNQALVAAAAAILAA